MSGFYKYAEAEPGFVAVVDPDGTEHTAGELLGRANRYVHLLRSLGLEKGDSVAAVITAAADEAGVPAEARLAHGDVPGFRDVEAALAEQPDTLPEDRSAG